MCLMMYLATAGDQPLRSSTELSVEEVESSRTSVRQWFSLPTVRFIGAHTGCSCGFPSVIAEEPIEYYDGIFDTTEDRAADLASTRALLALIRQHVNDGAQVELYPVGAGDEGRSPKGTVRLSIDAIDPETFLLTEQFLYRVRG
jgi:hypothetical protein